MPFVYIPNNDNLFFCKLDVWCFFFLPLNYHRSSKHFGWSGHHNKKTLFFSKLLQILHTKSGVIVRDLKLWCFSLPLGMVPVMIKDKVFNYLFWIQKSNYFLKIIWYPHIRHKIVDFYISKISHEHLGKTFKIQIL